jgi:hypothetical protein
MNDEFLLLNDLELYELYRCRKDTQSVTQGGFWTAFLDMEFALIYKKRARETDMPHYAQSCEEMAQNYLISAAEKDYPTRLDNHIQTTAHLLDVLNEMKRRL